MIPDDSAAECPMPEPFRARVGLTVFMSWLFFLGFVTRVLFAPLMPAIERDLGIGHAQAGSLFLMMSLGYLLAPLCSGLLSSRIQHRGTLQLSAWLVGLSLLPISALDSLLGIRMLLMVIGLAAGLHLPSAIATITGEIRKQDWGKALSVHQAGPPLSFICAPLIAAGLMHWVSWRGVLLIWSAVALISALIYSLRGRGGDFPGRLPDRQSVTTILGTPAFWIMVILFAMAMGGQAGVYAMLPLFLVNDHGMPAATANTVIGFSQLSGLLMVFVAGWVTDRIGQKPAMAIALLAAGLATLLMGLLHGNGLLLAIFIQPALLSSFFPAAFGGLSRIAPPSLRSVTSALGPPLSFLVGGGLLPTLIGRLGETHSFAFGMLLTGACMLLSPLLVLFLKLGQYDTQSGC